MYYDDDEHEGGLFGAIKDAVRDATDFTNRAVRGGKRVIHEVIVHPLDRALEEDDDLREYHAPAMKSLPKVSPLMSEADRTAAKIRANREQDKQKEADTRKAYDRMAREDDFPPPVDEPQPTARKRRR